MYDSSGKQRSRKKKQSDRQRMHYKQGIEICSRESINKHIGKNV